MAALLALVLVLVPACDAAALTSSSSKSNTAILTGAALLASAAFAKAPSHARPIAPMTGAMRFPEMCKELLPIAAHTRALGHDISGVGVRLARAFCPKIRLGFARDDAGLYPCWPH
ncbi:MAG TPA: hypothetical protein VHN17_02440 [Steroidobacteraceae bacterium]|nr:hypothetical protein [Steroidobacteraceae bacterium]